MTYREALREGERRFLTHQLDKHVWNVSATARDLSMPVSTLKFRIRVLGIEWPPAKMLADRKKEADLRGTMGRT